MRLRVTRWTRVMGQPAFWRGSMNDVNASLALRFSEYVSSCSSSNGSSGSSPSSNRRQRESSSTIPLSIQSIFTSLNELRSFRHSMRSASLCSSDDRLCISCSRVRCSTAESTRLGALRICATEDTSQSVPRSPHGDINSTSTCSPENLSLAPLNQNFSMVLINSRRCGILKCE